MREESGVRPLTGCGARTTFEWYCNAVDVVGEERDGVAELLRVADTFQWDTRPSRFQSRLVILVLAAFDGLLDEVLGAGGLVGA